MSDTKVVVKFKSDYFLQFWVSKKGFIMYQQLVKVQLKVEQYWEKEKKRLFQDYQKQVCQKK